MTTIAWDGETLAADSRATASGLPYQAIKAFRLADGSLFGGTGDYGQILAVKEWLDKGGMEGLKPKVEDFAGLLVLSDARAFRLEETLIRLPLFEKFHAIGSGRDFAIAAMHCGRTALEAVEISTLYDVFTGGAVVSFSIANTR